MQFKSAVCISLVLAACAASPIAAGEPEREGVTAPAPASANLAETGGADPAALAAIVDREATALGVPLAIARAVVRIESRWNPRVTGRAGEVGLFQIKHASARAMGFTGSRAELYDPATNARHGMRYLAEAWRLAGGDLCRTALKYQGGHFANRMTGAASAYCGRMRTVMAAR